ncbi:class I SAM-dependent methyltransferase [Moheibacter lacus]|uniref:Class I SAM-dependent methyltransferase n=1 Tax=Moheibacter lacus TaxID=2745851 RepID=A0A838ZSC0_9FLAO|nr:class I SAM-dependent methyltransferase [Moheibacter lacus]MBA5629359.1 class I SAM-dependent methyltransferase [Moheibacter lacus]
MSSLLKNIINLIPRPWLIRMSLWARPFLVWYFKGENFTDPIDGKSYRKFLPYGYEKQRENVLSPGTLSLERHRLMWLYLQKETDFFTSNLKVLHMAPEQSFYKRFRKLENLDYTTCDLDSPIADVKADIQNLPFKDNSFDVVFCNHVLEHVDDDKKALSELFRVMKPGGWGIFQVPIRYQLNETFEDPTITDRKERIEKFGQYDHVRVYGMDYYETLKNTGFEVEKVNLSEKLSNEEISRFALEKNEILPVVRKIK